MNKRRERPPLSDRGRRRALRTWGFYLLALTAWVTVVLAAVFLGYLVCSAFTWYAWDPLYQFLNWVRDYIVFVCMLVILLGWVAISYSFIARPMRLVDTLAAAAEQLAQPGEEPIELPEPMEDLEGHAIPDNCPGLDSQERLLLQDALAVLGEEERRIVLLHTAGLKHREIGQALGLPLATVLSKYHRALKKMRAYMEGDDAR